MGKWADRLAADDAERAEFEAMWPDLWLQLIPGDFDTMHALDQKIWRGVVEAAWQAGRAALRAELKDASPEGGT